MLGYNDYIEFKATNGDTIRIGFNVFETIFKTSNGTLRKPGDIIIDYKEKTEMVGTGTIYKFWYDDLEKYRCKISISHLTSVPRLFLDADIIKDKLVVHSCAIDLGDIIFTTNREDTEDTGSSIDPDAPIFYRIIEYKCRLAFSGITDKDLYNLRIDNH